MLLIESNFLSILDSKTMILDSKTMSEIIDFDTQNHIVNLKPPQDGPKDSQGGSRGFQMAPGQVQLAAKTLQKASKRHKIVSKTHLWWRKW